MPEPIRGPITGYSGGSPFPTTTGAYQTSLIGTDVGFVVKINPAGTALLYSTLMTDAGILALAIDGGGNAYIAGETQSLTFSTTPGAYQTTLNNSEDAFVTKINATGTGLVYSTFLGGTTNEVATAIAVDPSPPPRGL